MDLHQELAKPFNLAQLHWRVGAMTKDKTKAIALAYIDARDVMKRLDDVLGSDKWQNRYSHVTDSIAICEIGVFINDNWIWKSDGAGDSAVEAEKGRISDAFKRTAVHFGIARYLYKLPNIWCPVDQYKKLIMVDGMPQNVKLPEWATPEGYKKIIQQRIGE